MARRVRLRSRHHREADSCRQRPAECHRRGSRGLRVSRRHGHVDQGLHGATRPATAALQPVGLPARAARPLVGSGAGAARRLRNPAREMAGRPQARVRCATVARGRRRRPSVDVVDRLRSDRAPPVDRLYQRGELAARARRGSLERVRAARGDGCAPVANVSPAHDRELRAVHFGRSSRPRSRVRRGPTPKGRRSRGPAAILYAVDRRQRVLIRGRVRAARGVRRGPRACAARVARRLERFDQHGRTLGGHGARPEPHIRCIGDRRDRFGRRARNRRGPARAQLFAARIRRSGLRSAAHGDAGAERHGAHRRPEHEIRSGTAGRRLRRNRHVGGGAVLPGAPTPHRRAARRRLCGRNVRRTAEPRVVPRRSLAQPRRGQQRSRDRSARLRLPSFARVLPDARHPAARGPVARADRSARRRPASPSSTNRTRARISMGRTPSAAVSR